MIPSGFSDQNNSAQIYTKNLRLTADPFTGDPALPWRQPVSLQANPHYHSLKDDRFELVLALSIQLQQDQLIACGNRYRSSRSICVTQQDAGTNRSAVIWRGL